MKNNAGGGVERGDGGASSRRSQRDVKRKGMGRSRRSPCARMSGMGLGQTIRSVPPRESHLLPPFCYASRSYRPKRLLLYCHPKSDLRTAASRTSKGGEGNTNTVPFPAPRKGIPTENRGPLEKKTFQPFHHAKKKPIKIQIPNRSIKVGPNSQERGYR